MEAIHCSPPIPSSLLLKQTIQRTRRHPPLNTRQKPSLASQLLRARASSHVIAVAADASAAYGGDVSVLLPVSAVLVFLYWLANFVVPEIVTKEIQQKAPPGEEMPEEQTNGFTDGTDGTGPSTPTKPRTKIKKSDLKKMLRQR